MRIPILHTSDFHGQLTPEKAAQIKAAKVVDGLYFDCGDIVKTGNLGIPTSPEPAWRILTEIGCDAKTLGNRETHPLQMGFTAKLNGAGECLVANLEAKNAHPNDSVLKIGNAEVLDSKILKTPHGTIGIFGVMVAMVTRKMKTQAASAYLWDDPIQTAIRVAQHLRPQCDVLIALTHIGFQNDTRLAEICSLIDIILGGHSHTVLETPTKVGNTWISHTGSHGRFLGSYEWTGTELSGRLLPLG